jgi:hypothetical protein
VVAVAILRYCLVLAASWLYAIYCICNMHYLLPIRLHSSHIHTITRQYEYMMFGIRSLELTVFEHILIQ